MRASAAPAAALTCDAAALPLARAELRARVPVDRAAVDRVPVARVPVDRVLRGLDDRVAPDEPPEARREPPLADVARPLALEELPLLACGTSPPLRGYRYHKDTTCSPRAPGPLPFTSAQLHNA
jgi:hypothetical protein